MQNYYIACGYTDMRKQIDGLVAVVELQFRQKLDETSIFLFCGRRADRIKALYWDGTGYVLLYKRLAEKRFQWPRNEQELSADQKHCKYNASKRISGLTVEPYRCRNFVGRR